MPGPPDRGFGRRASPVKPVPMDWNEGRHRWASFRPKRKRRLGIWPSHPRPKKEPPRRESLICPHYPRHHTRWPQNPFSRLSNPNSRVQSMTEAAWLHPPKGGLQIQNPTAKEGKPQSTMRRSNNLSWFLASRPALHRPGVGFGPHACGSSGGSWG